MDILDSYETPTVSLIHPLYNTLQLIKTLSLIHTLYNSLQHTLSHPSLQCPRQSLLGNGSDAVDFSASVFIFLPATGCLVAPHGRNSSPLAPSHFWPPPASDDFLQTRYPRISGWHSRPTQNSSPCRLTHNLDC
jgi:hypothetical protein